MCSIKCIDIFLTCNFDKTAIPFNFSIKLYDIHSCSSVSDTASRPLKFLMRFRPRESILRFSNGQVMYIY